MNEKIDQLAQEMKTQIDAVKAIGEELKGKYEHNDKVTEGAKQTADEALTKLNDITAQLDELKQKHARTGDDGKPEFKTLGQQFIDAKGEGISMATFGKNDRAQMEVKNTITTDAVAQTTRIPGMIVPPQRAMTIRDLITAGTMDGNALEYVRETGFTNNAGMAAEGAKKPESALTFDSVTTSPKVIAHWIKASRQVLDDMPQLQSHIDGRLIYGLKLKEESQILNGDGTGQNLAGIIPQASAYAAPLTIANATRIDVLRLAMLQAVLAEYPASGFTLNPTDWAGIELTKSTDGQYIIGVPQSGTTPTLWGLPVVQTQAITVGKFLTGAFAMGAQVFDRWQSRVEVGYENDDFTKNLVTILAEERLALAVYRPEAFVYGDLSS